MQMERRTRSDDDCGCAVPSNLRLQENEKYRSSTTTRKHHTGMLCSGDTTDRQTGDSLRHPVFVFQTDKAKTKKVAVPDFEGDSRLATYPYRE